jgi:hypothetical protein
VKVCTAEEGCPGVVIARGLCQAHYSAERRRRNGIQPRGPKKEARLEILVEQALVDRIDAEIPRRERSAFGRSALALALNIRAEAGRAGPVDESVRRVVSALEQLRTLPIGRTHLVALDEIEDQTRALQAALLKVTHERDEFRQIVRGA